MSLAAVGPFIAAVAATPPPQTATAPARTPFATQHTLPAKRADVHDAMLKVWEEHLLWLRHYIISALGDLPDKDLVTQRLLRNQEDIGHGIKPYFGVPAGEKFTVLLKEHVHIAMNMIGAAKAKDDAKYRAAFTRWNENADDLATFLHETNPQRWSRDEMRNLLGEHLQLMSDVIIARAHGDWADDIAAHDKVHRQILKLTDALSGGIVDQAGEKTPARP